MKTLLILTAFAGAAALSACAPSMTAPGGEPTPVMCKAGELQWLVGKPRSEIPVPVDVVNRRVACTTCPVTEDYSPYRLNIFYNQQTGIVERVSCG